MLDGFSVGEYDPDGDLVDSSIYLCFGGVRVKVASDFKGYQQFIQCLHDMEGEIHDTCVDMGVHEEEL